MFSLSWSYKKHLQLLFKHSFIDFKYTELYSIFLLACVCQSPHFILSTTTHNIYLCKTFTCLPIFIAFVINLYNFPWRFKTDSK